MLGSAGPRRLRLAIRHYVGGGDFLYLYKKLIKKNIFFFLCASEGLFFYFGLLHTKGSLSDNDNSVPMLANRTSLKDRFISSHGSKGALKRLYSTGVDVKESKLSPY